MNEWILYDWWPGVLGFAKMVVFSFWWILAVGVAAFVMFIFAVIVKLMND